jgi:hypothetical protein
VGFVVDRTALGQVFSEYFGFPCQSSSTNISINIINHLGWHNRPFGGHSAEWTQLDSTPHYTNYSDDVNYVGFVFCVSFIFLNSGSLCNWPLVRWETRKINSTVRIFKMSNLQPPGSPYKIREARAE